MHSLVGYDSDDDLDETPPPRKSAWQLGAQIGFQSQTRLRSVPPSQADVNYEEVQMDLSEDSDSESGGRQKEGPRSAKSPDDYRSRALEQDRDDRRDKYKEDRERNGRDDRFCDDRCKTRDERDKSRDDRDRDRDRNREDRFRDRSSRDDRDRYRDDNDRDRYRDERDKYRDDRSDRDRDRGRDYRDKYRSRRSSSRERRSRSPRRSDYRRRSRSGSRDRSNVGSKAGYPRRYDRTNNRMDRIEKLGIDVKGSAGQTEQDTAENKDRFFMPGITGRFTEQIQRRKLLWQKKEPEKQEQAQTTTTSAAGGTKTGKLWEVTTFAQDQDGKVASKFKRLMGIKDATAEGIKPTSDLIKKQEEMFSSMEAQYEVARTATHTMRGVGLGFGSFQR